MPVYKVDFVFQYQKQGWSTGFYNDAGDPPLALSRSIQLVKEMMPVFGLGVQCTHIRVSDIAIRGDAVLTARKFETVHPDPAERTEVALNVTGIHAAQPSGPDPQWTALMLDEGGLFDIHNRAFLRGLPNIGILQPLLFNFSPEWNDALERFVFNLLDGGESWRARGWWEDPDVAPRAILDLSGGGPDRSTVIARLEGAPLPEVNDRVRLFGLPPVLKFNTVYTVTKVVGQTVTLLPDSSRPGPVGTILTAGAFCKVRVRRVVPLLTAVPVRITRRKIGRPFELYRGRQRNRLR